MKQEELQKYLDIQKRDGNNSFGSFNHAKDYYDFLKKIIIEENNINTIADLGCGSGEFVEWLRNKYPDKDITGIDPVFAPDDKGYFLIGDSTDIPLAQVDLLTSFDVMEHIHPDDLEQSMKEITRVSDFYITKIAYASSGSRGVNGEELHPLVRSETWWKDYLSKFYTSVTKFNGLLVCRK